MKREVLNKPLSAGSILHQVLDRYGLKAALSRHNILNMWPTIVNPAVARHAKAERLSGSTLHVVVDSSVWMNELAALKNVLLNKINACLENGAAPITDIRFQQRSWAKNDEAKPTASPQYKPTEQDIRRVQQILEPVKNEDLKSMLNRILEKDLDLKRSRFSKY